MLAKGADSSVRSSVLSTATSVASSTSQKTAVAAGVSASMGVAALSPMRWFSRAMRSTRRVAARAMTASSQPSARMASAPRIWGMWAPSDCCSACEKVLRSMVPPESVDRRSIVEA